MTQWYALTSRIFCSISALFCVSARRMLFRALIRAKKESGMQKGKENILGRAIGKWWYGGGNDESVCQRLGLSKLNVVCCKHTFPCGEISAFEQGVLNCAPSLTDLGGRQGRRRQKS